MKEMKEIDYCSPIVISRDEDHYIMTLQKTGETVEYQFAAYAPLFLHTGEERRWKLSHYAATGLEGLRNNSPLVSP